jgi:two-component system chemotaxis response regulator CheY
LGKRVLIVDDSQTMRELTCMTLEIAGDYEIEQACDGQEAQRLLQARAFDLVLTDLDMPNMGGDELIAWMKSQDRTRAVPIIVLTAGVDKVRQEIAQQYHIDAYLEKPFQPKQLTETVGRVLTKL